MKVGVLAVQGAFIEHEKVLEKLGVQSVEIRSLKDFKGLSGLILPGGESTVQSQLLHKLRLFQPIKDEILSGLPVMGTCAGLILLAKELENDPDKHLQTLPVTVKRNAYGRQLGSFVTTKDVGEIPDFPHVFIRAPYITKAPEGAKILSVVEDRIVGVEYKNQLAFAFHPEMTDDPRLHELFLKKI